MDADVEPEPCRDCGKPIHPNLGWCHDCDRRYLDLKGARERLCRAQTHLDSGAHRSQLQTAIDIINRVGTFACAQWSQYDVPDIVNEQF